jgi:hypothetical protein
MKSVIKKYTDFQTSYSELQWKWLKIPFILFWFVTAAAVLFEVSNVLAPTGVCRFLDCNCLLSFPLKLVIIAIAFTATIFYILEKRMILSISILSIVSILIFTIEDSQGIYNRNDVLSGILIAQLIAYLIHNTKKSNDLLNKQRILFSQQIILAIYFLSGVSKLVSSGFSWFMNPQGFAIQVQKSNMDQYIVSQNEFYIQKGEYLSALILSNQALFSVLLFLVLMIEILVVVTLFSSKKVIIFYGIVLILLHVGIWIMMSIVIVPIIVVNLIFFINIIYLIYVFMNKLLKRNV